MIMNKNARINLLKFFCVLGIVFLHTSYILTENSLIEILITSISGIGLPTFFFLSGFFFANRFTDVSEALVVKKIKRIIIPYLFWQIFAFVILFLFTRTGLSISFELPQFYPIRIFIDNIILGNFNEPLWYLRVIFVIFLFSPMLICLLKKSKKSLGEGGNICFINESYSLSTIKIRQCSVLAANVHKRMCGCVVS